MSKTARNTKMKTPGQSIIAGVKQAIAWAEGQNVDVRKTVVRVPVVDVKVVRERMNLSQAEFAQKFGFAAGSVRNWEQGRRSPEGPARILLAVIDRFPETVESVLSVTANGR